MLTKKTDEINIWRRGIVQGCSLVGTLFRLIFSDTQQKATQARK